MPGRLEIVSTSLMWPIFDELVLAGFPVHRLLEDSGVSPHALEVDGSFLPRGAARRFARRAVQATGDRLLFYGASSRGVDKLAEMASGSALGRPSPIYERLTRFLDLGSRVSSAIRLSARVEGDLLWLVRTSLERREEENWFFEQYAIGFLETAARRFFGPDVLPVSIRVRSRPRLAQMPNHWRESFVKTCQHDSAIAVPLSVLGIKAPDEDSLDAEVGYDGLNVMDLAAAISLYAKDSSVGLNRVADAFGMKRRSFQRTLARLGTSYSHLVEESRFGQALNMLRTPGTRITDVAMEAGYSHSENFTRAFRRRYGLSPRLYRKMHRQT